MKRVDAVRGGTEARVGWLADDAKGGMHVEGGDLTVAELAAVLELGTEDEHIPARPALRPTFDKMREELAADMRKLLLQVLWGDMSVDAAFGVLGAKLATAVKLYITGTPLPGVPPPNAPSTALRKAAKGKGGRVFSRGARNVGEAIAQAGMLASVRTWVDTGRLVNALTWVVTRSTGSAGQVGSLNPGG